MSSYDLRKLGHLDPHPIMAHPDFYPEHVLDMPLGADTPAIHNGVRPHGKVGDHRFIAHHKDLLGPDGRPLTVIPLFADRMRTGKIWYPGKDPNMKNPKAGVDYDDGHGGPGFGSLSQWYGKWGWANLHNPKNGRDTPSSIAMALHNLSKELPGGFIGAVTTGTHEATTGNGAFLEYLRKHLKHYNPDTAKLEELLKSHSKGKHGDVDSFIDELHTMGTSTRQAEVAKMIAKRGKNASEKEFFRKLKMQEGLMRFNDYSHIPSGHVVSLLKITPDHPHAGLFPADAPDGHPVYRWHLGGTYMGDLKHSVPVKNILRNIHGETLWSHPGGQGLYLYGQPNEKHLLSGVDDDASYNKWASSDHPDREWHMKKMEEGRRAGGLTVSMRDGGDKMRLDPEGLLPGVAKAVVIKMSPEHQTLDKAQHLGYNHAQEETTMKPYVLNHALGVYRKESDEPAPKTPEELEQLTLALIDEALHPHTQAKLHQAIRGEVKR